MSSYLEKRKQQILLNKKLLAELGLDRKVAPQVKRALPTPKAHDATSTTPSPKKRKVVASPAVPSSVASSGGSRTSTRIKRKIERLNLADYDDQSDGDYEGELYDSDDDEEQEPGVERQQKSRKRVADPQRQRASLFLPRSFFPANDQAYPWLASPSPRFLVLPPSLLLPKNCPVHRETPLRSSP